MRQFEIKAGEIYYFYNLLRKLDEPVLGMVLDAPSSISSKTLIRKTKILVGINVKEVDLFYYKMEPIKYGRNAIR